MVYFEWRSLAFGPPGANRFDDPVGNRVDFGRRVVGGLLHVWAAACAFAALDPEAETPAVTLRDDVDYVPIEPKFLLSQHFSAIAAAGPIVGPIVAGVASAGCRPGCGFCSARS